MALGLLLVMKLNSALENEAKELRVEPRGHRIKGKAL